MNLERYFPKLAALEEDKLLMLSVKKKSTKAGSKAAIAKALASNIDTSENKNET